MNNTVAICGSVGRHKDRMLKVAGELTEKGYDVMLPPFDVNVNYDSVYVVELENDKKTESQKVKNHVLANETNLTKVCQDGNKVIMQGSEVERLVTMWWWDIISYCDKVVVVVNPRCIGMNTFSDLMVALYMDKDIYIDSMSRHHDIPSQDEWFSEVSEVHKKNLNDASELEISMW